MYGIFPYIFQCTLVKVNFRYLLIYSKDGYFVPILSSEFLFGSF